MEYDQVIEGREGTTYSIRDEMPYQKIETLKSSDEFNRYLATNSRGETVIVKEILVDEENFGAYAGDFLTFNLLYQMKSGYYVDGDHHQRFLPDKQVE